ncbi:MAG TPA: hypothetical protein VMO26_25775, partial [Vicinamibacterales bacterium]|nr:hypothetical protein [Vicinamibacterales bacterium]
MIQRSFVFAIVWLTLASTSEAQLKEPIGPFVADVRLVSSGLPAGPGWTPLLPANTVVPSRGLGLEVGAHVNVVRRRSMALGVGATWLVARGATSPPEPDGTTPAAPPTVPRVNTRMTAFAPQLSLNFGHSLGWSYLSAGLGRVRVESDATLAGATTIFTPRDSDWVKTLNFGGGARWFVTDRLGVGFDVRWHKVSLVPASATHPGAGRASLLVAGAGIV